VLARVSVASTTMLWDQVFRILHSRVHTFARHVVTRSTLRAAAAARFFITATDTAEFSSKFGVKVVIAGESDAVNCLGVSVASVSLVTGHCADFLSKFSVANRAATLLARNCSFCRGRQDQSSK